MKKNILKISQQFLLTTLLTYLTFLLIRFFEYSFLSENYIQFFSFDLFLTSIRYDAHFVILISAFSLLLFLAYFFFRKDFILTFHKIFLLVVLFISLSFTQYFLTNKDLLGTALFSFSLSEIMSIAGSEFSFNRISLWLLYLILPGFIIALNLLKKIKCINNLFIAVSSVVYLSGTIFFTTNGNFLLSRPVHYEEEIQYYLVNNKILYLAQMSYDKYLHQKEYDEITKNELSKAIHEYRESFPSFEFISDEFPLLHKDNYANALGKYFPATDEKPNLVFLIVEGLSSSFVGSNARIGNLMPFLDSLILRSLYWENFFSNAAGTYGALPSIFASLPNGYYERGFVNIPYNYPKHNSMINILNDNGYESSFYYAGDSYFDQMNKFLRYHGVEKIYDAKVLDKEYFTTVVNSSWSSWGIDDKRLFEKSFELEEQTREPYLKIYLTLSIHSPYNIVPPEYLYDETVRKRLEKLNLPNAKELKRKHKDAIGSIFLADDALRYFFEEYSKKDEYENTIFLITGDHAIKEFPFENELEKFHVPLIIYSPMLKESAKFSSISSHIDITPGLLSLLKNNFGVETPNIVHWLGKGLNTSHDFETVTVADMGNFSGGKDQRGIYKDYFSQDNKIFKINYSANLNVIKDPSINKKILSRLDNLNLVWRYATLHNKIFYKQN